MKSGSPEENTSQKDESGGGSNNGSSVQFESDVFKVSTLEGWQSDHETILARLADQAMCYHWMTSRARDRFEFINLLLSIPVVLISTVTGTANFAQSNIAPEYQSLALMTIGGFNIFAGMLHTLHTYLKITHKAERFKVSNEHWRRFYELVKFELSRRPSERIQPSKMISECMQEFQKLLATTPVIPEGIKNQFKKCFSGKKEFQEIYKPVICDFLETTRNAIFAPSPGKIDGDLFPV